MLYQSYRLESGDTLIYIYVGTSSELADWFKLVAQIYPHLMGQDVADVGVDIRAYVSVTAQHPVARSLKCQSWSNLGML